MTAPDGRQVPSYTFPIPATGASQNIVGRAVILRGIAFKEATGGAPASFDILDGSDANGSLVLPVTLLAGQSFRESYGSALIVCRSGPFLRINSGSITGALWIVDLSRLDLVDVNPARG